VLRRAYERGITLYDTANMYLDSEEKIGTAFAGMRDRVVIASKSLQRDGAGMADHVAKSLRRLRTDYIDLYQLHQVSRQADWQAITAPGGALEALLKARDRGDIRHIGVTSHSLEMAIELVKTCLFASIQFPFNIIETAAAETLHVLARERHMGILAMKPFAGGMIDNARIAFAFLRQSPHVVPIPGFDSVHAVDQVASFYDRDNEVSGPISISWTATGPSWAGSSAGAANIAQPCPNGVLITLAMAYRVIASRMSPAVAVNFARTPMESVLKCNACGACLEKCPTELPIPDMRQAHYRLYEEHLKAAGG
jgi:predicted aldo/keto reductase-like oxidoreductase